MRCFVLTLIIFAVISNSGHCQDKALTYSLPQFLIYQNTNGREHSFLFEGERNRLKLYHDTMFTSPSENESRFAIADLTQLSVKQGNCFWKGAGFGALVGFTVGMIVGLSVRNNIPATMDEYIGDVPTTRNNLATGLEYGAYYGLISGAIGGLIGLLMPSYHDYDLAKGSVTTKRNALMKIFEVNNYRSMK